MILHLIYLLCLLRACAVIQISASRAAYEADLVRAAEEYQNHLGVVIDEKKVADSKFEARLDELTNAYNESQRENSVLRIKMNDVVCRYSFCDAYLKHIHVVDR